MKTFDKLRKGDKIFVYYSDTEPATNEGIVLERKGRCLTILWGDDYINEWYVPDDYVGKSNWKDACTDKELIHQIKAKHAYERNEFQFTRRHPKRKRTSCEFR